MAATHRGGGGEAQHSDFAPKNRPPDHSPGGAARAAGAAANEAGKILDEAGKITGQAAKSASDATIKAGKAVGKAVNSTGSSLPKGGKAFISVKQDDKETACYLARRLRNLGFTIVATEGTAQSLKSARIPAERVNKVMEGSPHVVDSIRDGEIALVINTTQGSKAIRDSYSIRRNALLEAVPTDAPKRPKRISRRWAA